MASNASSAEGENTDARDAPASSASGGSTFETSMMGWTTGNDWSFDSLTTTISARASEALNELNSVDVRAMAEAITERASEAARDLEHRADEAFGLKDAGKNATGDAVRASGDESADASVSEEKVAEPDVSSSVPSATTAVKETEGAKKLEYEPKPPAEPKIAPRSPPPPVATEELDDAEEIEMSVNDISHEDALKALKDVKHKLKARENEIARRAAQYATLDAEQEESAERAVVAEQKLVEAEARIKELMVQCKTLKKQADAYTSVDMLVKEKDEMIKEVMAEGEVLSKKQADMEGTIKKLRLELKERNEAQKGASGEIQVKDESIARLTQDLDATHKELSAEKQRWTTQLSEQKEYYLSKLAQAKEELTDVEVKANMARSEELAGELKSSREREQSLKDQISDLQHSLQRSNASLERQEERFKNDLAAVEERCQAAESSHDELLRRMPESTRPLLRQIEALQLQANESTEAWAATQKAAAVRLADAESRAESAAEREAAAIDEKESAEKEKQVALERLAKINSECDTLKAELEDQRAETVAESAKLSKFSESFAEQEGRFSVLEDEARKRETNLKQLLAQERGKHKQSAESWDGERAELLATVAKLEADLKVAQNEIQSSKTEGKANDSTTSSPPPAILLTGGEAGLSLMVRDTLATLKSQLAARETELQIAQDQIKKLEQTRDSLANELVNSERLADGDKNSDWEKRYAAALEVIGEREEECDELRDRIRHLRTMLDSQARRIEDLESEKA